MIDFLVLGSSRDINVNKVVTRLRMRGLHSEILDANGNTHVTVRQAPGQDIEITVNGHSVDNTCLIWSRTKLWVGSPVYFDGKERDEAFGSGSEWRVVTAFRVGEWGGICKLITSVRAQQTVNNPHIVPCMHKIVQQAVANKLGLSTPPTLLTTAKEDALTFLASGQQHVLKTSAVNLWGDWARADDPILVPKAMLTQLITESDVREAPAEQVEACPHMFQKAIQKSYELRVVVIRRAVYAFRINSMAYNRTKVDWRANPQLLKYERTTLPAEIVSKLLSFMEHFDLFSGSFDFIVDDEGRYWFLECNPEGVWAWLDAVTEGEIADEFTNAFETKINELRKGKVAADLSGTLGKLSYVPASCAEVLA